MFNVDDIFEKMRDSISSAAVRIKELKESGIPVVGTYCTFTPWELIHSAGAIPVSLCSTSEKPIAAAERHLPRNLCPLIKSSYGFALTDTCPYFHFCDLVVGETTCDGKKKMYEYLAEMRPVHVMQLPQTVTGKMSLTLWKYEVLGLKEALERRFNTEITDEKLKSSIKLRSSIHNTMNEFYDLAKLPTPAVSGLEIMLVSDFLKFSFDYENAISLVKTLTRQLLDNYHIGRQRRVSPSAKRILITGCPMGKTLEKVTNAVESSEAGAVIVGFENCGNLKCSSYPIRTDIDPISALSEKYLKIPCSVMSPNDERMRLIKYYTENYRAHGVIDVILQACHTYNVETRAVERSLKDTGMPYLSIETDYSQGDVEQLSTRIGAFAEMI